MLVTLPLALVFCVALLAMGIWGILSLSSTYGVVSRALRRAHRRLDGLGLDAVTNTREGGAVQEAFDLISTESPALSHALSELAETTVTVDERPRLTADVAKLFAPDALVRRHAARAGLAMSPRGLENLSGRLFRVGALGAITVLASTWVDLSGVSWADPAALPDALARGLPGVGLSTLPILLGLLLAIAYRSVRMQRMDDLDRASAAIVSWIDAHYRRVTAEEILVRVLDRLGRAANDAPEPED